MGDTIFQADTGSWSIQWVPEPCEDHVAEAPAMKLPQTTWGPGGHVLPIPDATLGTPLQGVGVFCPATMHFEVGVLGRYYLPITPHYSLLDTVCPMTVSSLAIC